jgi:hypothetical protein
MKDQREMNIKTLVKIRDDKENLPAVRLQSGQTMQKLIDKDDPQTKKNITTLQQLRDSDETGDGVRIQVVQTLQKILDLVEGEPKPDNKPGAEDIMNRIRSGKK